MYMVRRISLLEAPLRSRCCLNTSNNVFFNLWSACLLSTGTATLPMYSDWGQQCQDGSLTLKDGYPPQFRQNMNLPGWAFLNVPPSTSQFDVSGAMQGESVYSFGVSNAEFLHKATEPREWTKTQIMLPMAVGMLGFALLVFYIWRSRFKYISLLALRLHPQRPVHQIKRTERSSTWTIDPPEALEGFPMTAYDNGRHHEGHHRLPSSETVVPLGGLPTAQPERHLPGKKFWKYSRIAQPFRRLSNLVPPIVQSRAQDVPSSNRFRIDAFTSMSPNSQLSTSDLGAGRYTRPPMTTSDIVLDNHEGTSLISPEERNANRVLLITRYPDMDFTVESGDYDHIEVIPATPTSDNGDAFAPHEPATSPRTVSHPYHSPSQFHMLTFPLQRPVIPPTPKTPPPSPPPAVPLPPLPSKSSRQVPPQSLSQPSPRRPSRNTSRTDRRPSSSRESRDVSSPPSRIRPMSPPLTPPLPMPRRHLAGTPPPLLLHPLLTDPSTKTPTSPPPSSSTRAGPHTGTTPAPTKQNVRNLPRPNGKRARSSTSASPSRPEHTAGAEVVHPDHHPPPFPISMSTHERENNRRQGAPSGVFIPKEPPDRSMNKR